MFPIQIRSNGGEGWRAAGYGSLSFLLFVSGADRDSLENRPAPPPIRGFDTQLHHRVRPSPAFTCNQQFFGYNSPVDKVHLNIFR